MLNLIWINIRNNFSNYEIMQFTLIVLLFTELPILFFTILDFLKLESLKKYRIHYSKERVYPENHEIIFVAKESYKSFFKIYIPLIFIGCKICNYLNFYPYKMDLEIPNFWWGILELFLITILGDIFFYWLHRFFHTPFMYKRFHKKHHEYKFTFAVVHHYLHDVETVLFLIPPILPPVILNSHIVIMWLWMIIAQLNGILGHSGYYLPMPFYKLQPSLRSEYHDTHHYLYNKNFGLMYIFIEKMFGTYHLPNIKYINE